ncbi:hypothetical protein ACUNWD_06980 [Sunxiuqinia sp. A32]|uniref:hypothetical protein n=1 Tax=Sunxiuqinia sp. A32 TaxID=3461496 RepID=UPI00404657FA
MGMNRTSNIPKTYDRNQIIKFHIQEYHKTSVDDFFQTLAGKYITDKRQREIFLKREVWLKIKLNYIGGLMLSLRGKEIFSPKDIRDVIREEIIPSLTEISDNQLSGMLLTSDVHKNAVTPKWHNGHPCLEKVSRGKYRLIGFEI